MELIGQVFSFLAHSLAQLSVPRAILGFILVFFLPGFVWTLVFFKQINRVERVALSFGLSLALVALSVFAFNVLLGVRITGLNSVIIIGVVVIIPVAFYYLKRFLRKRRIE